MDLQTSVCETSAKKVPLEDLSKDELIKKCKSLLIIAQKAKQSRDSLVEENNELKTKITSTQNSLEASNEITETVTGQKLELTNTIQELQMQNNVIEEKMKTMHFKMSELDTENISYQRQVNRLTDENEQLIVHLDSLEKKIHQLTVEGLQQQEQLLALESKNKILADKNNLEEESNINELQNMLARTLEEVQNLQNKLTCKDEEIENNKTTLAKKEECLSLLKIEKEQQIETLDGQITRITKENQELNETISTLKENLAMQHDLNETNIKLREKLKNCHSKIIKLAGDIKILKQNRLDLLKNFKLYTEQVIDWKNELNKLSEVLNMQNTTNNDEKKKLTDEINELIKANDEYKMTLETTKQLNENLLEQQNQSTTAQENLNKNILLLEEATSKYEQLESKYNELLAMHKNDLELTEKSGLEILNLVNENKKLSETNDNLIEQLGKINLQKQRIKDASQQTIEEYVTVDSDFTEQLSTLKREHHEVLNEMNEMNQALKERGETISKQQAYCDELLKKIQHCEAQFNKKCDMLTEKEEIIQNLQSELTSMNNNNKLMNDSNNETIASLQHEIELLKDSMYAESENMSTSTISKTEEVNRLKDLDSSWEEKYSKLRALAVKLKTKIRTITEDLSKEQIEKVELQQKLANNTKVLQIVQTENDKLQDELDSGKKETKNHLKKLDVIALDISKDKKQLASNDEEISRLKAEIDAHCKDKINIDNWKKQVSMKVQSLKKEIEANAVLKKDFENKITKLQNDLEHAEKLYKDEREKHNETRNSLQESTTECKKQSVLNLEMHDYERSIKDLSQKLEKKQEVITKLKSQLDSQKSALNSANAQNKLLEESCNIDRVDLEAHKQELKQYKTKINELELLLTERDSKILEATHLQENIRIENEDLSTQLSNIIAENQKAVNNVKSDKENLRINNIGLEQRLRELKNDFDLKCNELDKLKEEHQAYKVRAQSVLRQNQSRDVGLEENLKQEISTLKVQNDILTSEAGDLKTKLEQSNEKNQVVLSDKEAMSNKNAEIYQEIEEWKDKYVKLENQYQQTVAENAETVRGLKVHADTLGQCYRQQLSDQEIRHNREVIELQSKLEKGNVPPDIPPLLLPSMQREEGEGSESVESTYNNNAGTQPVPLEKLLSIDNDHEITIIKKQLLENESKVAHLTALLADTEQDLVKHVQMNKLLKEEIRRQQRSVEREQHAENLEYLKNIVFKFLTLNSGDEKGRLVPVLNTILKLSPEESNKLNLVAKGDKGWSNYLPLWPNKSQ